MKQYLLGLALVFSSVMLSAQNGWEAGGWIGTSHYFGDLNTNFDLSKPGLAGGFVLRYDFNKRLALKLGGSFGSVSGDDALSDNLYQRARNLSFRSPLAEGLMQLEFNFFPYVHGDPDYFFTPYVLGGFNVFYFNPQAEIDNEWIELRPLGTEGQFKGEEYYTVQGGLAFGIGFKIDLNYYWSLNFEIGARKLFTDYLDDVSTVYPDLQDLEQLHGELAAQLSDRSIEIEGVDTSNFGRAGYQRGDSSANDTYVLSGISIVYYFGGLKCPEYSR